VASSASSSSCAPVGHGGGNSSSKLLTPSKVRYFLGAGSAIEALFWLMDVGVSGSGVSSLDLFRLQDVAPGVDGGSLEGGAGVMLGERASVACLERASSRYRCVVLVTCERRPVGESSCSGVRPIGVALELNIFASRMLVIWPMLDRGLAVVSQRVRVGCMWRGWRSSGQRLVWVACLRVRVSSSLCRCWKGTHAPMMRVFSIWSIGNRCEACGPPIPSFKNRSRMCGGICSRKRRSAVSMCVPHLDGWPLARAACLSAVVEDPCGMSRSPVCSPLVR
jgi:hypothetical protein